MPAMLLLANLLFLLLSSLPFLCYYEYCFGSGSYHLEQVSRALFCFLIS